MPQANRAGYEDHEQTSMVRFAVISIPPIQTFPRKGGKASGFRPPPPRRGRTEVGVI